MTTKRDILDWLAAWDDSSLVMVFDQAGNELDIEELNEAFMSPAIVVDSTPEPERDPDDE